VLDVEFDRVKQHVFASQFSSQTAGKDLASPGIVLKTPLNLNQPRSQTFVITCSTTASNIDIAITNVL